MRAPAIVATVGLAALLAGCSGGSTTDQVASTGPATSTSTTPPTTVPTLQDPAGVTATLIEVERGLRIPGDPNGVVLGQLQERAYATLTAQQAWRAAVLAALPPDVAPIVASNLDAIVQLGSLNTAGPAATKLPNWTVRAPLPEAQLVGYYHEAEAASGIPWAYLAAIHLIESRLGRIMGPSGAGAQGPMQFIPATWAQYGRGNINDDHDAIVAAGRYLAARGGAANIGKALLAYNADSRYVRAVEDYANVMLVAPAAFDGYYQWPVFFQTATGTYLLPEGYPGQPAVRRSG